MGTQWLMPATWQEPDTEQEVPPATPGQESPVGLSAFGISSYDAARVTAVDPPVSQAQRGAMHAAAAGRGRLGIPRKVAREFVAADPGGKLPRRKRGRKR